MPFHRHQSARERAGMLALMALATALATLFGGIALALLPAALVVIAASFKCYPGERLIDELRRARDGVGGATDQPQRSPKYSLLVEQLVAPRLRPRAPPHPA